MYIEVRWPKRRSHEGRREGRAGRPVRGVGAGRGVSSRWGVIHRVLLPYLAMHGGAGQSPLPHGPPYVRFDAAHSPDRKRKQMSGRRQWALAAAGSPGVICR